MRSFNLEMIKLKILKFRDLYFSSFFQILKTLIQYSILFRKLFL